jgi:hypothetical protein
MKATMLWALVVVNVALLVVFLGRVTHENAAMAQPVAAAAARPGDYLMVPGEIPGGNAGIVYVVDTTNGWLGAMAYDDTRNALDVMPRIELDRVFDAAERAPANPTPRPGAGGGAGAGARGGAR